jgi:arylsulfatase A-like enzyme
MRRALLLLGATALAWAFVLCGDLLLRRPHVSVGPLSVYLPATALVASATLGAGLLAMHGLHRLLRARLGARGDAWLTIAVLALCGVPAVALSAELVEGDGVASSPHVAVLRWVIAAGLCFIGGVACAYPLLAAAPRMAENGPRKSSSRSATAWRALSMPLGVASVSAVTFAISGPLRPYASLSQLLTVLAWLVVAGLALRAAERFPRASRLGSMLMLTIACASLTLHALAADRLRFARTEALSAGGLVGVQETFARSKPTGLGRFDFRRTTPTPCAPRKTLPTLATPGKQRANVILLSIDTMRRDALGKRFGGRAVAPSFERFAAKSVFFERAVAPASSTLFSMASALSGYGPSQVFFNPQTSKTVFALAKSRLKQRLLFLPQWPTFKGYGYKELMTAGATVKWIKRGKDPVAPFLAALQEARADGRAGLFWLHLVEPHLPYSKQPGFDFGSSEQARYYGEVASADALMGRALDGLQAQGRFDDSLIIAFSDHGESLGEDGYFGHGIAMGARFTDVPLIVHAPGMAPRSSRAAVSLTSIAPTILHFLDLPMPPGASACSLLIGDAELERCPPPVSTSHGLRVGALMEFLKTPARTVDELQARQERMRELRRFQADLAFVSPEHRYILDLESGSERLFNRVNDPAEASNLIHREPGIAQRFRAEVMRWSEAQAQSIRCTVDR